jgi:hypothetical protein
MLSARYFLATADPMRAIWCHVDLQMARGLLFLHALVGAGMLALVALTMPCEEGSQPPLVVGVMVFWTTFQMALTWVIPRDPAGPPAEVTVRLAFAQPALVIPSAFALALAASFPPVLVLPAIALALVSWRVGGKRPVAAVLRALLLLLVLGAPITGVMLTLTGAW